MESSLFVLGLLIAFGLNWARVRFAGFLAQAPDDYRAGQVGEFDIRTHLNGPVQCEGVIYGPLGRVASRFDAEFDCLWQGNTCVMKELFRYGDGSTQSRAWNLSLGNDGRIRATAEDVVGEGTGIQMGDAVQLKYRIKLPKSSGGHELDVVDWMYLTPGGVIINRSQFRKFGIKVAELVATMRPMQSEAKQVA